jgi:hypothetical protein
MQEGNRPIELHLGVFAAGDGEVNDAQGMAGMLRSFVFRFVCAARK